MRISNIGSINDLYFHFFTVSYHGIFGDILLSSVLLIDDVMKMQESLGHHHNREKNDGTRLEEPKCARGGAHPMI